MPTLIEHQGIAFRSSLAWSFVIAVANPLGPMLAITIADKVERKWLIVSAAIGITVFGLCFAAQRTAALLILFGVLLTLANNVLSFAFHAYRPSCSRPACAPGPSGSPIPGAGFQRCSRAS